jgi:hypothetical protein
MTIPAGHRAPFALILSVVSAITTVGAGVETWTAVDGTVLACGTGLAVFFFAMGTSFHRSDERLWMEAPAYIQNAAP